MQSIGKLNLNSVGFKNRVLPTAAPLQSPAVEAVPQSRDSLPIIPSGYRLSNPDLSFEIPANAQAIIGRRPESELQLLDQDVSRSHAVVQYHNGQLQVMDIGSTNGTYVNGKAIEPQKWHTLAVGSQLKLGNTEFKLSQDQQVSNTAPSVVEHAAQSLQSAGQVSQGALPVGVGWVLKDLQTGTFLPLPDKGTSTLGRDPGNDLVISDSKVSRRHASFYVKDGTVAVLDSGSTNGVGVNGQTLTSNQWQGLHSGDRLQVGDSKFRLMEADKATPDLNSKEQLQGVIDFHELIVDPKKQQEKYGQIVPEQPNSYWKNNAEARQVFEDYLDKGDFTNAGAFESMLKTSHRLAVEGSSGEDRYYSKHGEVMGPDRLPAGVFHEGVTGGIRDEESKLVEGLALRYGDPYRLDEKKPAPAVALDGIAQPDQPMNMPFYGGQRHFYPKPEAFGEYFGQMRERLDRLEKLPPEAKQAKLQLIGEFFQYGANVRPFHNVNNSLFMNFTNALLKRHGFQPVYHGILDHAAHRLQPQSFNRYFQDWAAGEGSIAG